MATPLKDIYSADYLERVTALAERALPAACGYEQLRGLADRLAPLAMKARAELIADALCGPWPAPPDRLALIDGLLEATPLEPGAPSMTAAPAGRGAPLRGFDLWPVAIIAERLGPAHPDAVLARLPAITCRFTAEFAIRPVLLTHPERTFARLHEWVEDPDERVRRLVSEGTRTRLPWGQRLTPLIIDPSPALPLLERLRDDPSEFVRRSVANHLNDLSRDHPALVLGISERWLRGASDDRQRLVRHALRTLVKAGDPTALRLVGADDRAPDVTRSAIGPATVRVGEPIELSVTVANPGNNPMRVVLDYAIHFVRARGDAGRKVFKGATIDLAPGEERTVRRAHSFRPITTRRYHAGQHRVDWLANGQVVASHAVTLTLQGTLQGTQ